MSTRPRCALTVLCIVQGCERFAFFAMLPLFVPYLRQRHGFTEQTAIVVLGVSQALAYFGALPAGALIDRGFRRTAATLLGCALLTLGYGALTLDRAALLWPALSLLIVGHSFFRPGLSAMVTAYSPTKEGQRERAFLLLHLAVNLGAWGGPLCSEWARRQAGLPAIFLCSTLGMLLGSLLLSVVAQLTENRSAAQPIARTVPTTDSFERERIRAVGLICCVALVFWIAAQQAGSSLALFADNYTRQVLVAGSRSFVLRPTHFASLHALIVLLLLPISLSAAPRLQGPDSASRTLMQMVWGYLATAAAFALLVVACRRGGDTTQVSPLWLSGSYLLLSLAEVSLSPLGLALVTQLAPPRLSSRAVGLWFLVVALGNGVTGALGLLWGRWLNHQYFALLSLMSLTAGAVLLLKCRALSGLLQRIAQSSLPTQPAHTAGGLS